ncbi:TonB-dependent receptor [Caulobacter sp. Root1455]|jgi:outer membrane receptor protein involved in Fe transport|uniref:TonB-dependent receptor n=1 Tax=Caulobacter sp. Root1455 TaxID=1736465 RepID=UPI0006F3B332|nr:TonB-dependent receptor [Caulobacter sp. Root1455]
MPLTKRNTHGSSKTAIWTTALLATSMLTGVAAQAQTAPQGAPSGSVALEEVVVTAQKRSENLQDVPISIQALGTKTLEERHITGLNDYIKFLPSVSIQTTSPGFSSVFMRGIVSGDNANHSGPLPTVGTYLDEQPITTIQGALDLHIYDIARVEALAGPQGTLYGASSQAGTVRIITNKPSTAGFSAGYDLEANTIAHGDAGYVAEGFVNQPISDSIAVRLVGWAEHDGGYIDNVPNSLFFPTSGVTINNAARAKENYNDVDTYGGRAALRIELGENWVVTPTIMGQQQKVGGLFSYDPSLGDLKVGHFYPENSDDKWAQAALTVEGQIANLDVTYAGSYLKREVDSHSDYTDYSYFYDTMTTYGAYWTDDAGNPVNPAQYINGNDRYSKVSHEIRVASPQENRLRFVAGVFYQRQTHGITQDYKIDAIGESISVPGYPHTIWLTKQKRVDRDEAVFGELAYDITDQLTITGGIRFFKAHNTLKGFFGYGAGYSSNTGEAKCFTGPEIAGSPCTNLDKGIKEDGNSPKVTVTYKVTPDKLIYATYSEGFRPGGINRRGTIPPYTSDYLKNYEAGWKTTWLENRLRWNGSVYLEKWQDFQVGLLGANGLTEIRNAGAAEVKGVETDVNWAIAQGWTLNASGAYTSAHLTEDFCEDLINGCAATGPDAPDGSVLPITPKLKFNLTTRYEWDIGDLQAHVQGSAVYQSGSWTDLRIQEREIIGRQNGYTTADFTAGIARDSWTLEAYIKNAFDKRASLYRYAECIETVCGGRTYVVPNQPRLMGIKFGQRF